MTNWNIAAYMNHKKGEGLAFLWSDDEPDTHMVLMASSAIGNKHCVYFLVPELPFTACSTAEIYSLCLV